MASVTTHADIAAMPAARAQSAVKRLVSLDILRGVTIAFMIMVNNNGGDAAWAQMHHADWNGLTATDLVFPTFLFAVGVSIVFATQARLMRGETRGQLAWHASRAFISSTCAFMASCSASPSAIWRCNCFICGTGAPQPKSRRWRRCCWAIGRW
jgi:predicted acyltransferase